MSEPITQYLGPTPSNGGTGNKVRKRSSVLSKLPISFIVAVIVPTLIVAFYYLVIATPMYVSESRFVVRQTSKETPSALGMALQGVGITAAQSDAFAVHDYIQSHDAIRNIGETTDLRAMWGGAGRDWLSRFPRPWEKNSDDALQKALTRYVEVGYDSTTGLSTLRVSAFTPQDASSLNEKLLASGEDLVNRLNERANRAAVNDAALRLEEAEKRLAQAQQELTSFRERERILDPALTAEANSELIGRLMSDLAKMKAERDEMRASAPDSPELPIADRRIAAYERQLEAERSRMAGDRDSLAPKLATFEQLSLEREYAARAVSAAKLALDTAGEEARRQKLYLEQVVKPHEPSDPSRPKRFYSILVAFVSLLIAYGTGWMVWAGIREHRLG